MFGRAANIFPLYMTSLGEDWAALIMASAVSATITQKSVGSFAALAELVSATINATAESMDFIVPIIVELGPDQRPCSITQNEPRVCRVRLAIAPLIRAMTNWAAHSLVGHKDECRHCASCERKCEGSMRPILLGNAQTPTGGGRVATSPIELSLGERSYKGCFSGNCRVRTLL
jgi:hypothetical protein